MFKRTKEDFICEQCGKEVIGNGYTNHCPHCLYSKHVDNDPGDRLNSCNGLMEPIGAEEEAGSWNIIYRCQKCGVVKKNKVNKEDNFDLLIKIQKSSVS